MHASVLEGGLGGALGVNGGWLPLPTRPQRCCDLASHVLLLPPLNTIEMNFLADVNGKSVIKKIEPGISSLGEGQNPPNATEYIRPLLNFAADHIPK